MPKRAGATEDGARYNKLQRPENWPAEPARKSVFDLSQQKDLEKGSEAEEEVGESSSNEDDSESSSSESDEGGKRQRRKRGSNKNGRAAHGGCLPLDSDSGSENGTSFAALEYLRGVRAEANDAQFASTNDYGDDTRGYYEDGAYVEAPAYGPFFDDDYNEEYEEEHEADEGEYDHAEEDDDDEQHFVTRMSACEAYTAALLSRFYRVQVSVRAAAKPGSQPDIRPIKFKSKSRVQWGNIMSTTPPSLAVIAVTPTKEILNLLSVFTSKCLKRDQLLRKETGLWILALLARLDKDTLGPDDCYTLRELAKKAIWLRIAFEPRFAQAADAMGQDAGYIRTAEEEAASSSEEHAEQSATVLSKESEEQSSGRQAQNTAGAIAADEHTIATLDMIVTIVGEVFGQRDLLESRAAVDWPNMQPNDGEDPAAIVEE